MNEKIERIKSIAAKLAALFPGVFVQLGVEADGRIDLYYHGTKTYREGTEWLRSMGASKRAKTPHIAGLTYTTLKGEVDGVTLTTFPDELPPSCRKVVKVERIPKVQTVETGEYIEVKREVIECGPEVTEEVA